jgi:hypothetical protein
MEGHNLDQYHLHNPTDPDSHRSVHESDVHVWLKHPGRHTEVYVVRRPNPPIVIHAKETSTSESSTSSESEDSDDDDLSDERGGGATLNSTDRVRQQENLQERDKKPEDQKRN